MYQDLIYQLALTKVPLVGPVLARALTDQFGSAENIFRAPFAFLEKFDGMGQLRARKIKDFTQFEECEKEIRFLERYNIHPLFLNCDRYPRRLLNCYDPPTLMFYKGEADLNNQHIVGVIGTRNYSDYGKHVTEKLIADLEGQAVLVVSGLAFGVDALAHRASIKHHLPTVGVLAHGLDSIYPYQHHSLAKEMVAGGGGLLTEFWSRTKPDRHHFPTRNRIVAGMCDAIVIVESGIKGGSMVTAELANGYNKDVFAFPGRCHDAKSAGCNFLIRNNKAELVNSAADILESMGWLEKKKSGHAVQRPLFTHLSDTERQIVAVLEQREASIDELYIKTGIQASMIASSLLSLELQSIIQSLPGKMYRLI